MNSGPSIVNPGCHRFHRQGNTSVTATPTAALRVNSRFTICPPLRQILSPWQGNLFGLSTLFSLKENSRNLLKISPLLQPRPHPLTQPCFRRAVGNDVRDRTGRIAQREILLAEPARTARGRLHPVAGEKRIRVTGFHCGITAGSQNARAILSFIRLNGTKSRVTSNPATTSRSAKRCCSRPVVH